ncbi:MAG: NAD(P)-dependent glycerol-3-phosphate dehydrogenase [Deltaproteobacteria bacterium]|nr:NAD(P)-dependent glycerol-3-phosphate dehydrogenase [Deltaproteobacteria bacterium]
MSEQPITILGGGSMGTALGKMLGDTGIPVRLWVYEPELVAEINSKRENTLFLPGSPLPAALFATGSMAEALSGAGLVISAMPAQVVRRVWTAAAPHLAPGAVVVSASKGIEVGSAKIMSEVLAEVLDPRARLAFLSGPSFAKEVAAGQPTAVVVASTSAEVGALVQKTMFGPNFRVYTTDDVVGVELGGALKNVIAIAVGAAEGLGLGHNARAALITRGLAEISRLAVVCGANPLTLAGLAGVGDLVLTCTGHLSRNLQVGIRLGRGERLADIVGGMRMVAEGVETSRSAKALADGRGVEMPITDVVVGIIDGALAPADAVRELMSRRMRSERER